MLLWVAMVTDATRSPGSGDPTVERHLVVDAACHKRGLVWPRCVCVGGGGWPSQGVNGGMQGEGVLAWVGVMASGGRGGQSVDKRTHEGHWLASRRCPPRDRQNFGNHGNDSSPARRGSPRNRGRDG